MLQVCLAPLHHLSRKLISSRLHLYTRLPRLTYGQKRHAYCIIRTGLGLGITSTDGTGWDRRTLIPARVRRTPVPVAPFRYVASFAFSGSSFFFAIFFAMMLLRARLSNTTIMIGLALAEDLHGIAINYKVKRGSMKARLLLCVAQN